MLGDLFNLLLLQPLINIFYLILVSLENLKLPGSLGLTVIIFTILIKVILWPFSAHQIKATKHLNLKLAELRPELERLRKKHKDDKVAFARAQQELYAKHGINPMGGCLPALVQTLLIWPLYQVIMAFLNGSSGLERINYFLYFPSWRLERLPDPHFLGLDLAKKPADFPQIGWFVLLVPIVTGLLQLIFSLMLSHRPVKKYPSDSPKEKHEKDETEQAMEMMQTQMIFFVPIMIAFFSYTLPIGLSVYWNVINILSIFQQYIISGWGGLEQYLFWRNKQLQK